MIKTNKTKVVSLQALRGLAFFGIFLGHAGSPIEWSALGVSVFFILSGCLLEYNSTGDEVIGSIKESLKYSIRKISKLYPLHIITMSLFFMLNLVRLHYNHQPMGEYGMLGLEVLLNILLLQTWPPVSEINYSLNGVAWFLSAMLFLYFMFPYIQFLIRNLTKKSLYICCCAILSVEVIISIRFVGWGAYEWLTYVFPVFRIGDLLIGCSLGKIFREDGLNINSAQIDGLSASIFEVLLFLLTIMVYLFTHNYETDVKIIVALQKNLTTVWIPLALLWVIAFIYKKGIISIFLTNRYMIWIGDLSAYLFLIHNVVLNYIAEILSVFGVLQISTSGAFLVIRIIVGFVISVILTLCYLKLNRWVDYKCHEHGVRYH